MTEERMEEMPLAGAFFIKVKMRGTGIVTPPAAETETGEED